MDRNSKSVSTRDGSRQSDLGSFCVVRADSALVSPSPRVAQGGRVTQRISLVRLLARVVSCRYGSARPNGDCVRLAGRVQDQERRSATPSDAVLGGSSERGGW